MDPTLAWWQAQSSFATGAMCQTLCPCRNGWTLVQGPTLAWWQARSQFWEPRSFATGAMCQSGWTLVQSPMPAMLQLSLERQRGKLGSRDGTAQLQRVQQTLILKARIL